MGFFRRRETEAIGSSAGATAPLNTAPPHVAEAGPPPPRQRLWHELPWLLRVTLMAPLLGMLGGAGALGAMFIYYTVVFPDPLSMRPKERGPIVRILAQDGSVLSERGARRDYMPLDLLPRRVSDAVVATEDRRFYDHWGLDPAGVVRAAFANLRAGRFEQGGSTLTQQLAKNLFLTPERTLARKVEELVLAFWLELRLSKSDILELYLNRVYFGGGAYGIEAAAQRYFAKSARELTLAEAAIIAGLLKAPSKYAPSSSPAHALARGHSVLAKMRAAGFITEEQEAEAKRTQVGFSSWKRQTEPAGTDYAADFALEQLAALVGEPSEAVVVETTLDAMVQRRASDIVERELSQQGESLAASQAALVVLANDGAIRALVGGRSHSESQFNRAVKARRQPGSAFKPFVYLAALEAGFIPDNTVYDLPLSVGGWAPRNDNGRYAGAVTLRQGLAQSINTVAVRLLLDTGAGRVAAAARRLGIRSPLRKEASLALGTSEVSLLELTGAYGAFANGGYTIAPYAIRQVRTGAGRILYTRQAPKPAPSISSAHVAAMNDMLTATLVSGTGRRAALPTFPAAGKTGTSQDFRDAWFVGYTAYLTAGVWVGNDNGRAMNRVTGGSLPADIWRQVMLAAHEGKAPFAPLGAAGPPIAAGSREPAGSGRSGPSGGPLAVQRFDQAHPRDRINDDFVARALAGGTLEARDRAPGAGEAEPDVPAQRIIVRPPDGFMSLGNRPR